MEGLPLQRRQEKEQRSRWGINDPSKQINKVIEQARFCMLRDRDNLVEKEGVTESFPCPRMGRHVSERPIPS
jgi:hypothetical protein